MAGLALLVVAALATGIATAQEKTEKKDEAKKEEKKEGLTLKAERTIEFTTDEGTWLSLDVSPDGQTLVLELLGDLYTLPIAGGQAKPLTTGMAFDSQRRASRPTASGSRSSATATAPRTPGSCLPVLGGKADGTEPKKLSDDKGSEFASPNWTPDSQYVVVSRTAWGLRTFELWEYHIQGGSGVQLTKAKRRDDTPNPERHNALGAVFSPDGRYLYYARKLGGFVYNLTFPQWQIARRDMITGDEDILTQDLGSAIRPLLSPDGQWLVYGTRYETQTGLRLRNLKTGEDHWLKYPVQRDDQESRFTRDTLPGYAFTPDGKETC
jgi:WD40 repeat protein